MNEMTLYDTAGNRLYLNAEERAVFREGVQGPPMVHGLWEPTSGKGIFATLRGLGT